MTRTNVFSCHARNGREGDEGFGLGGRVCLVIVNGNDDSAGFTLTNMDFSGCEAIWGKHMFLNAFSLSMYNMRMRLNWTTPSTQWDEFSGFEGEYESLVIPLLAYIRNLKPPLYHVGGSEGHDHSRCGFVE